MFLRFRTPVAYSIAMIISISCCLSCKNFSKEKQSNQDVREDLMDKELSRIPVRIQNPPADNEVVWGYADVDAQGAVLGSMTLSLDYFPQNRPGQAALPVCRKPLRSDFVLGMIRCEGAGAGSEARTVSLTAANVAQECYAVPAEAKMDAQSILSFPGCRRIVILGYHFSPALRVSVEKKL